MRKKSIVIGTILTLGLTVAWWASGGTEPVFKQSSPVKATSERYSGKVLWQKSENDIQDAGEASRVAVGPNGDIYYLHRATVNYGSETMIKAATIIVFDGTTHAVKRALGRNMFQSPHGLEVDAKNNIWVTDISLNQVVKLNSEGSIQAVYGQKYLFGTEMGSV
ncbi:hypothetical protein [Exiguobacterium antarcticum]|uniref:NHL repeat containing protein n=1 Tax=Exiguobacterium antarcticum TaxID=132920 RepID=A0ABT6R2K0_9BACL|nr:hypothetical protein [Exiguobacterium antarcticum]MDI3235170.1 hypothetical protein [Exiguobacterium antarcticum]